MGRYVLKKGFYLAKKLLGFCPLYSNIGKITYFLQFNRCFVMKLFHNSS